MTDDDNLTATPPTSAGDIDVDLAQDDFSSEPEKKYSIKEMWDTNPLLKILVVVVGLVAASTGFFVLTRDDPADQNVSHVQAKDFSAANVTPGQEILDPQYKKAVEEQNKQRVDDAMKTGGSAIVTPTNTAKDKGLIIPEDANSQTQGDPLAAWKKSVQAKRIKVQDAEPEEDQPPQPDLVPVVQPIRPQVVAKMDPNEAKALAEQMRTIIASLSPEGAKSKIYYSTKSMYVKKLLAEKEAKAKAQAEQNKHLASAGIDGKGAATGGDGIAVGKVIIPAGQVSYAQLLNELNSDIVSPVLAQVLSGPFEGGRAIGTFEKQDEFAVLSFKRVVKDGVTYQVNGIALDEATTLPATQTSVDHHYFTRVILPAAAKFIEGYGASVAETGQTTTTTAGGGEATEKPQPGAKENLYKALSDTSSKVGSILDESANKPVTVHVARGTTFGLLFLESVKTTSVE